jgi:hypothetical protein
MVRSVPILCSIAMAISAAVQAAPKQQAGNACFAIYGGISIDRQESRRTICVREIDHLLGAPIKPRLEWPKYKNEGWVSNCRDYLTKVGYGRYWDSFNELPMEAPYMRTCGLLAVLATAKQGQNAFKSHSQALSMAVLPPTIAFSAAISEQYEKLEQFTAADISAEELISKEQWPRETGVSIRIIAVADVNGDGINDYIVERSYSCTDQCSDHAYHVGYLSPKPGRKVMQWVRFDDDERIKRLMPN